MEGPDDIRRRCREVRGHMAGGRLKRAAFLALQLQSIAMDFPRRIEAGRLAVQGNPSLASYFRDLQSARNEALEVLTDFTNSYTGEDLAQAIFDAEVDHDHRL